MQARTRRNRVAILVSMALIFTTTSAIQGDRDVTLRSGAAGITYAAGTGDLAEAPDVQADAEAVSEDRSREKDGAEGYQVADWWKADLYEYDRSLQLVSYEAANTEPDDPLTTTTAVITDTIDLNDNEFDHSENSEVTVTTTTVTTVSEPTVTARQLITAEPDSVVFYSSGYGHGVGMSQNGANFYAMYDGWTYDQILMFYYPGTQLVQTGASQYEQMTVSGKTDNMVSILSQICYNEMGSSFSDEAIKAQAIAAYSYYLYNGHGAGMICKANPPQKVVDAVRSVAGMALYYDNKPALTSFYASSGGATASCKDIFYADIPYLRSQPVRHDESSDPHYNSTKVYSADALRLKLQGAYNVTLTGNPYDWIKLEYGDGGYVCAAVIGGQVRVKGNDLRGVLGLKSPKFEFVYQQGTAAAGVAAVTTAPAAYADPSATHASISALHNGETTAQTTATTAAETTSAAPVLEDERTGEPIQDI